jgi:16S rRNA (cytidine1402-2'-O)-methyltransferase
MQKDLYIVPTPIGNLEDMTFRAVRVLGEVDAILAEDTRKTGILLKHYEIQKPLQSYHSFNEHKVVDRIVERLKDGECFALVSDAGTPAISDPGFLLVRACLEAGLTIECLPGATAFVPALVNSGLAMDKFIFDGFLPHKKGRKTRLELISQELRTVILYESPYRLVKLLNELILHCGVERRVSVSREISKMYEETTTGTLQEVLDAYKDRSKVKGEIVVVLEGMKIVK